jgi:hypothetical protein
MLGFSYKKTFARDTSKSLMFMLQPRNQLPMTTGDVLVYFVRNTVPIKKRREAKPCSSVIIAGGGGHGSGVLPVNQLPM